MRIECRTLQTKKKNKENRNKFEMNEIQTQPEM